MFDNFCGYFVVAFLFLVPFVLIAVPMTASVLGPVVGVYFVCLMTVLTQIIERLKP